MIGNQSYNCVVFVVHVKKKRAYISSYHSFKVEGEFRASQPDARTHTHDGDDDGTNGDCDLPSNLRKLYNNKTTILHIIYYIGEEQNELGKMVLWCVITLIKNHVNCIPMRYFLTKHIRLYIPKCMPLNPLSLRRPYIMIYNILFLQRNLEAHCIHIPRLCVAVEYIYTYIIFHT